MAEETKRIIEIEAKYESLADLQAEVTKAKAALDDMMKGQIKALQETQGYQEADLATKRSLTKAIQEQTKASADYQSGLTAVKALTTEYNAQMRMSAKEYSSVDDGIKVTKNSYNDLVNQLARAKQAWKNADPKTDAYVQATREVNRLKGDLEAMDHSIGNWQRNVGNYGNSIRSVAGLFGKAGGAASGAVAGVMGLTAGFEALSATPVIGTITIIVSLLAKVIGSLKQSEAASMRMAEAMAPLKAGGDLLKIAFEGLANGLAAVAEWLGKVADKLGLYSDRMKENQALVKEGNALKKREREILVENSKLELEAAKARNIATDKANNSVQERIKALEQAEAAEKKILANELEVAQKKFDLQKRQAALSPNDAATNDALAQAEANLYRVQTNYEQGMRRIIAQHSEALREMGRATKEAVAETSEGVAKLLEIDEKGFDKMDNGLKKQMEERKAAAAEEAEFNKIIAEQDAEMMAEFDRVSSELNKKLLEELDEEEKAAERRKQNIIGVANAIGSVLDSVAGAYQNEIKAQVDAGRISEAEGEKQFQNVKALQIAVSTIQMLTGITTALSGAFTMKATPLDYALAIAQAASIAAAGTANIVKIKNTNLGNTQTSSATGAGVQSIQTVAPAVQVAVPEYRTLTSASDEQSINERYANQKVVLVTSELEAHNAGRKVTLQESTF